MTTQALPFRTRVRAGGLGSRTPRRSRQQSGVALLTTLLLLILVSLLGLTMAVSANSDMMINSFYGSYRGSFYAADSGLNIARAAMMSQISGAVSTTACPGWQTGSPPAGCTAAPMNGTTTASNAQTYLTSTYNTFTSLNAGQAAKSWPGNFMIANLTGCTNKVQLVSGGPTHQNANGQNDIYVYTYGYEICSVGRAQALQQVNTKEDGNVIVTIKAQGVPGGQENVSFSAFGAFIDNFQPCQGPLVPGTMTGPFFTNGAWNFGTSGSYIYTDPVSQANAKASYWINGNCYQSPTSSYTKSGQTIKPTFQEGFNLGANSVPLPQNDFVQQWAVIDGVGCGEKGTTCGVSAPPYPTNSDLNAALRKIDGTQYPVGGTTTGVFIPYCTLGAPGCITPNTITGGGFYVEGDASVQLSLGNDALGNPTQTYTITQPNSGGSGGHRGGSHSGSGNTVTTITVNINANTTKVVSGSTNLTLAGVPENKTGATPQEGAMVYVDGTITGLGGPGQGQASIQDYYATTVSAADNINITGDLIYKHEPVTLNTSDNLVSGNDFNQVLGVFTTNGNIVLSSSYSNKNLETDASLAAINSCSSGGGSCPNGSSSYGFATSGSINTWTVVGGRIESYAHGVSISTGNTYFDKRFTARTGFAPPFFPSTTVDAADLTNAPSAPLVTPTVQRTTWVTWPQ